MRVLVGVAAAALVATACRQAPVIERVTPEGTPTPAVSSLPPPDGLRAGPASKTCVKGWGEPKPATPLYAKPLALLRAQAGVKGALRVEDLRYFIGPDDANLEPGSKQTDKPVERWYGKVVSATDPSFKVRFLAVQRKVGSGVVAVAAYDTEGFASPDWYGFDGEGGRSKFPTLPGRWPGTPYDYVKAKELPPEVAGCLS